MANIKIDVNLDVQVEEIIEIMTALKKLSAQSKDDLFDDVPDDLFPPPPKS